MPLSWNEIKSNAISFSKDWETVEREAAEAKPFWEAFFEIFGLKRRLYATFEEPVRRNTGSSGFIDLFWPGVLMVEHKSRGASLNKAESQAYGYIQDLGRVGRRDELPRYLILSDFGTFRIFDLEKDWSAEFPLRDLHKRVHLFAFIAGYEIHEPHEEDPANFEAVNLLARLRDALGDSGFEGHDLERFLVRILFCLFAEDTGIFERESFSLYLKQYTREDGADVGPQLAFVFEILNTPVDRRQKNLEPLLAELPFVNGGLFAERLGFTQFDRPMRDALMRCSLFDWSKISPVIFGSLFQSVMDKAERRQIGGHYTSERDIMKLIRSLFLDDLWADFEKVKRTKKPLRDFHSKLGKLKFMDPACGCGNFLVVAYRELRRLEIAVLDALYPADAKGQRQGITDIGLLSLVDVDCMHGIEISEFPARIAEVAMWLIDHQMNLLLAETFGQYFVRLPLKKSARIVPNNALRIEWSEVIAPEECSFIMGNPPFVGGKYQDADQREDFRKVASHIDNFGLLDFVTGWHIKAQRYMEGNRSIRTAFVSTNSITQGEQVGILWPYLLRNGVRIHFAHRTFKWASEARGKAHVHVVIIGFGLEDRKAKFIFDYHGDEDHPTVIEARNVNPYLTDGPDIVVTSRSKPLCDVPPIGIGNKPIDGGHYLFGPQEKAEFLEIEEEAAPYFKKWIGSEEFINGKERWVLWLGDANPSELRKLPECMKRIEAVKKVRLGTGPNSKGKMAKKAPPESTQKLAATPTRFHVENMPTSDYLVIPEVSSERREYIPFGYMPPNVVASNLVKILPDASHFEFGVLSSEMHMAWVRHVGGRMKSDYRYSIKLVYNNFPWPENPSTRAISRVEKHAKEVLKARAAHPTCTMADLYDPLTMPQNLLRAHQALDKAVDKLYRPRAFQGDLDRFTHLIELYGKKVEGMAHSKPHKRGRKKKS